ncbi:MAG: D-glycero-beta-D-manno-heptose-7-phosphate kinase [Deltaproteobacteria bacterium]|nr:D-glycero-beta-D-manno-heptose-7-phosphate kinase [Deltaproteobacteria bacterium]
MNARKEILSDALQRMQGVPVLVIGDVMLDRYIWGIVDRISAEAPVPVVKVKRIEERLGGAGNVIHNLRNVGAEVSICGYVGNDDEGTKVLSLFRDLKVNTDGVMVDSARPTTVKTRVIAHQQQVVRIDREDPPSEECPLDTSLDEQLCEHISKQLQKYRVIVVSDYAKGAITERIMNMLEGASKDNKISLAERPLVVDPHPEHYHLYRCMSVGKPNRKEAEAVSGVRIKSPESAGRAAEILIDKWKADAMLISLGEDGLLIARRSVKPHLVLPTQAREVSDVSGAGDTVTAIFAAALGAGAGHEIAGELANIAAGVVVSEVGTTPVDLAKMKRQIARL